MSYFVIVCNSADNSLGLYDLGDTGKLTPSGDFALPGVGAAGGACPMTLGPDRKMLYVAFRGVPHEVLSFAIDGKGRQLKLLGRAPLADSMAHIAVDSAGKQLFSASYGGGKFSVNPIGADGVAGAPSDTLNFAAKMHCCIPVPGTQTVFATSLADDAIYRLTVDAAGRLTKQKDVARTAPGNGPRHLVLHPKGRFAYLVTEMTSTINVFGLAGDMLSAQPLQTLSIQPPNWQGEPWAADIRITPGGKFVYASDRKANSIACFSIDSASGRLTYVGVTYGAPWPRSFNISADGKYLLALGENSDLIDVFAIEGETGALDKRHTLPTGHGPSWIEIISD